MKIPSFAKPILYAIATTAAVTAPSFAQTYQCSINSSNSKGWVPTWVLFTVDEQRGTVKVLDPITFHSLKNSVTAPIRKNTDTRTEFKWQTGNLRSNTNQESKFTYSATFLKKSRKLVLFAKARAYSNDFSGRGPCKPSNRRVP